MNKGDKIPACADVITIRLSNEFFDAGDLM
jgi:hypothetical protein